MQPLSVVRYLSDSMRLVEITTDNLGRYSEIPIRYLVRSRLADATGDESVWVEMPIEPYSKDYDSVAEEQPCHVVAKCSDGSWFGFGVVEGDNWLGGVIVISNDAYGLLEGMRGAACLVDLRVAPSHRGHGIGGQLVCAAVEKSREVGFTEVFVETQDTNVAACRLYARSGFRLARWEPGAYGDFSDEIRLIWSLTL